jgi:hypothetical protein
MCVVIIAAVETKSCSLSCHLSSDSVSFILVQKRGRASGKSEPWFISWWNGTNSMMDWITALGHN